MFVKALEPFKCDVLTRMFVRREVTNASAVEDDGGGPGTNSDKAVSLASAVFTARTIHKSLISLQQNELIIICDVRVSYSCPEGQMTGAQC